MENKETVDASSKKCIKCKKTLVNRKGVLCFRCKKAAKEFGVKAVETGIGITVACIAGRNIINDGESSRNDSKDDET